VDTEKYPKGVNLQANTPAKGFFRPFSGYFFMMLWKTI
jgi:hypothetical protein